MRFFKELVESLVVILTTEHTEARVRGTLKAAGDALAGVCVSECSVVEMSIQRET